MSTATSRNTVDQWSVYCLWRCHHITASSSSPNASAWPSAWRRLRLCTSQSYLPQHWVTVGIVASVRRRHSNRPNRLPESHRDLVREHIRLYPAELSHYSRHDNPNRKYLPATLTINSMCDQYTEWIREKEETPVSSSMYRSIFVTDFNLGFGNPRTDTCFRCETLSGDALADHKAHADEAFRQQAADRQSARK